MDFWDLTKLVFRRWYVAVPLLVLTGLAAAYTTYTVKPDYKATAYVQLIPPPEASITENIKSLRNPWLDLGLGALNTAATYATVDKRFLNELKTNGMSDNVVITNGYPAPIATVEVIGSSQEMAMETTDAVVKRFNETVKSLQDDYAVQIQGRILTRRLDTGNNLEETGGKVKRALVAIGGAGVLLTAGLTVAFDALMRRRRRSSPGEVGPDEGASGSGRTRTPEAFAGQRPGREHERADPGSETVKIHLPSAHVRQRSGREADGADPGSETVKIQLPKDPGRQHSVPVVNGGAQANGVPPANGGAQTNGAGGAATDDPAGSARATARVGQDAKIILPGVFKPGEGRGSKS